MLVTLSEQDRLADPYRIDDLIAAEIPNQDTEPDLYELVKGFMFHGPCGKFNQMHHVWTRENVKSISLNKFQNRPLLRNRERLFIGADNLIRYILINSAALGEKRFSCAWIVLYNPYLLLKYPSHINVEPCASFKSVKYLHKYFFKNPDGALIKIVQRNHEQDADDVEQQQQQQGEIPEYNEVEHYSSTKYMSATEAAWHFNQFVMHNSSHTVYRLPVYLPQRQRVVFQVGTERNAFDSNGTTMLTGWFDLNRTAANARNYLYTEIAQHYVWSRRGERKMWTPRQRRFEYTVSRMYSVSIRYRELYYLRTLLLYVRRASSFEDVRTVDGDVCETFEEACR